METENSVVAYEAKHERPGQRYLSVAVKELHCFLWPMLATYVKERTKYSSHHGAIAGYGECTRRIALYRSK